MVRRRSTVLFRNVALVFRACVREEVTIPCKSTGLLPERLIPSSDGPAAPCQPCAPAPGSGSGRPGVCASARRAGHGSPRADVAWALLTGVPGGLRRDAVQLPHDPAGRAGDGAA